MAVVVREKLYVDLHLRVSPEVYRMLWSLASASGRTLGAVVEELVLNTFSIPVEKCPAVYDLAKVVSTALARFYNAVRDRELGKDICMPERSKGLFHYWFCRLFVLYLYAYIHDMMAAIERGALKPRDVLDFTRSEFGDPDNFRNLVESASAVVRRLSPLLESRYNNIMSKCGSSQTVSGPSEKTQAPRDEIQKQIMEMLHEIMSGSSKE